MAAEVKATCESRQGLLLHLHVFVKQTVASIRSRCPLKLRFDSASEQLLNVDLKDRGPSFVCPNKMYEFFLDIGMTLSFAQFLGPKNIIKVSKEKYPFGLIIQKMLASKDCLQSCDSTNGPQQTCGSIKLILFSNRGTNSNN